MSRPRLRSSKVLLTASVAFLVGLTWDGPLAAEDAIRALQKLAEKQGHPKAAVKALKDLGYEVPPDVQAEAAGVTRQNLLRAMDQGGPFTSRLETALGRKLSADQVRRITESDREHARQAQPARRRLIEDVVSITGLPEAKVRKILSRDQGTSESKKQTIAQIEKQLGRPLSAADAARVNAARDTFRTTLESHQTALAGDVAKIVGVPQFVVLQLIQ